jgi:hypothetical protein
MSNSPDGAFFSWNLKLLIQYETSPALMAGLVVSELTLRIAVAERV